MKLVKWEELQTLPHQYGARGEVRFCCPFCVNEDTGFHLYINLNKRVGHCFKCETVVYLKAERDSQVPLLDEFEKEVITYKKHPLILDPISPAKTLPMNTVRLKELKGRLRARFWNYLTKDRGLLPWEVYAYDLRYCVSRQDPCSDSVIFGIWDKLGNLLYYIARKITPESGESKYLNAPWPKAALWYSPKDPTMNSAFEDLTVVCEGPFDAIKIARVAPAYCSMGKRPTLEQLSALSKKKKILILLDPDAYMYAVRLKLALSSITGGMVKVYQLRDKDPGAMSTNEIKEVLNDANLLFSSRSRKGSGKRSR